MVGWAIVEAWRPTTVHGVHECYRRFSLRFVFIVTWSCVCLGFGLWEMSNTLTIFLQYAVKTSAEVTEAKREGIPFPAITICHSSIGKKSFFGGSKSLTAAMMSMLTRTTDVTKLVSIIDSCTDKSVREASKFKGASRKNCRYESLIILRCNWATTK